jgi:hypothetical protein
MAFQTSANTEIEELDESWLKYNTSLQRESSFLNLLVIGLIALHFVALLYMSLPPIPEWYSFALIITSLTLNFSIFYLNRRGYTQLAAYLFCVTLNIIIFSVFFLNLIIEQDNIQTNLFGYMLAINILLAGMLISANAIIWFTLSNTLLVITSFLITRNIVYKGINQGFPIVAFFFLLALISWLYQKTLDQALDNLAQARQEVMQARILQRDIEIARDLQRQLYPPPPRLGQRVRFAARCQPARDTSGDFYDFIDLGEDQLGIVVADVSGKSISAALVMTMARSMIRQEARLTNSPAAVLRQVNHTAMGDTNIDKIITAFYGILDARNLGLRYANAGHPFPLLKRNGYLEAIEAYGLPLKVFSEARYQDRFIQLQPGDQLIWISDGIVEAYNPQNEFFGFERLEEVICQANGSGPDELLEQIWRAVAEHQGLTPQSDDITLVVAQIGYGESLARLAEAA